MNDFHGLLPMAPPRSNPIPSDSSVSDEGDFGNLGDLEYVFGARFRATDSLFRGPADSSSSPVFDKPLFDVPDLDDLLPGFGASTAPSNRNPLGSMWVNKTTGGGATGSSRQTSPVGSPQRDSEKKRPGEEYDEFPSFGTYSASVHSHRSNPNPFFSLHVNASDDTTYPSDDVWLTISEILLATQPTISPPPSRPPPPKPPRISKDGKSSFTSQVDGLEEFFKGRSGNDPEEDRTHREVDIKEQEQRRIEREPTERDRIRQAVEKAMREARERAAAEARSRAEKAAVMKLQDEARERAERAAVLKAHAAALERAAQLAAEAKQRAERENAEREAKEKAERDAKEKEARAKAAAAAANQKKNEDDFEFFFGMGSHASTAPRPVASSSPKALFSETKQRDHEAQQEQAERHRISETFDAEIKRWSAGKEGNLRSLLSTLQYVLWPECGWKPVSLTDLITGELVKKVYWKATLLIHPDKMQQKGATLQQKYIAEKVFHLLQEAWNKFKSEELF